MSVDLGQTIDHFAISVRRERFPAGSTYANGDPVYTAAEIDTIQAVIQPPTGTELLRQADADVRLGVRKIYTRADLRVVDNATARRGDVVHADGDRWEVYSAEPWCGIYTKAFARKVTSQ